MVLIVGCFTAVTSRGGTTPVIVINEASSARTVHALVEWFDPEKGTLTDEDEAAFSGGGKWRGDVFATGPGGDAEASQYSDVSKVSIYGEGAVSASWTTGIGAEATSMVEITFTVPVAAPFTFSAKYDFAPVTDNANLYYGGAYWIQGLDPFDDCAGLVFLDVEDESAWEPTCTGAAPANTEITFIVLVETRPGSEAEDTHATLEFKLDFGEPRIEEIHIQSSGISPDDPETGKNVNLWADLDVPAPFEVQRCTWTGNNFTEPGEGDPDDSCRWSYTPIKGEGPKRETYGDKNLTLTVAYRYDTEESAFQHSKSRDYKVFFKKSGDDDSDAEPNWFDYWGDDGAVPTMDAPDVKYKAELGYGIVGSANGVNVFLGPSAAEQDGARTVPETPDCDGGSFPAGEGIDLAALTLSHERKHNELDGLGGHDADCDGVPDSAETVTSPTNPDSCNLAGVIHSVYASYGDHEFLARLAELGVTGVAENDWGVPGRQTTPQPAPAQHVGSNSGWNSNPFQPASVRPQDHECQEPEGAAGSILTGVYASNGQDTDADGLFNLLTLDVGVNIDLAGEFSVTAWLANDLGEEVVWALGEADLPAGLSTVQLTFDGTLINRIGALNPLQIARVEVHEKVGKHSVLEESAVDVHTTAFVSADFDPPAAVLAGVITEVPQDLGADGLYDSLDLTIEFTVNDPGEYEISAQLNGTSMSLSASATDLFTVADSTEQVTLSFDGASVFYHREDGPYQLDWLRLTEVTEDQELDFVEHAWTTAAYSHTEFQHSGVVIDENSYLDMPGGIDANGKITSLDVTFSISSMVPDWHEVHASLEDVNGKVIVTDSQTYELDGAEGMPVVEQVMLSFPGLDISASGVDGPYRLANVTVISLSGEVTDLNPAPYMTAEYFANDFVGGGPSGADVIFTDGFESD